MFEHSVRVPRLYKVAGKIAQKVAEDGASVKQLVYEKVHPNIKALFALVVEILKHNTKLDYLIRTTQILIKENRLDPWLTRVLITELLWGKKQLLATACKPVQTILKYKDAFNKALENYVDDSEPVDGKQVTKPRYVRVNTLKISVHEVIDIFRDEGWTLLKCGDNSDYGAFLATAKSLSDDQFLVDIHMNDLLVFPPYTQFHQHPLYKSNEIILQDKASCLSPFLLAPEAGSTVLDMCAAPGMKTGQLAAMVGDKGKIFAIERDQRRYETLRKLTDGIGATNVKCINKDVMTITNKDIPDIEYILVDPTCSGSGMINRLDFESREAKCNKSRLQSLAGFQITILRHALCNFPKVKRVIYSTCSVYSEENEEVVEQVLKSIPNFKIVSLKEKLKPKWFNFGSNDFGEIGECSLHTRPEEDLTNGFFVTLFERCADGETNPYFVKRVKRSSECLNEENQNVVPDTSRKRPHFENESMENKNTSNHVTKKIKTEQIINDPVENITNVNKNKKLKKGKKEHISIDSGENCLNKDMKKKNKKKNSTGNSVEPIETVAVSVDHGKKSKPTKMKKEQISTDSSDNYSNAGIKKKPKKKISKVNQAEVIKTEDSVGENSNKKNKKKCKKKNKSKENPSDDV